MDPRLAPFAERPAPRYTSYPTAPHFSPAIGPETMADWLQALPPAAAVSLYLHVPYCREICWYCGCHTVASARPEPVDAYGAALAAEIALAGGLAAARGVRRIHWGGGTPNALSPARFTALMAALGAAFDLSGLEEHAIEIDPRTLTPAHIAAFAAAGVNRASLGVQDLNPHVQEAIGRVQPAALVAETTQALRAAGIAAVNFDLMYGLPGQTVADAVRSATAAAALGPDRLAVFAYAHVPWFKARQKLIDEAALPGAAVRFAQGAAIAETLTAAGYRQIGFDHFAKPEDPLAQAAADGALRRNFQGFVEDDAPALIGLGASAISSLPQGYAQNAPGVADWGRAITAGTLATARGCALTAEDRRRRTVIERVLCDGEVDLAPQGGLAAFDGAEAALAPLRAAGLAWVDGDRVGAAPDGRPFLRLIAQAFDAYREGPARHSKAV